MYVGISLSTLHVTSHTLVMFAAEFVFNLKADCCMLPLFEDGFHFYFYCFLHVDWKLDAECRLGLVMNIHEFHAFMQGSQFNISKETCTPFSKLKIVEV